MKRMKFKRVFIAATLGLLLGVSSCSDDDKEPGGGGSLQHAATVYNAMESVYTGTTTVTAQYVTVDGGFKDGLDVQAVINEGKLSITLPATPSEEALFDGKGWGQDLSGILIAHYSFEGIGIGKNYADAAHLELYWQKDGVEDMSAGWYWADPEHELYVSLQEMLDAGYKLYIADLITYTVSVSGMANQSFGINFDNDVTGLSEEHILIYPNQGEASLEGGVTGSARQWEAGITASATGAVNVLIDKWGVSRQTKVVSVSYLPSNRPERTDRAYWVTNLPNSLKIKDMAIPGTHDSGAWHWLNGGMVRCQTRSISEQLNDGIRFLDIRVNAANGRINHGPINLPDNSGYLTLDEVMDDCVAHLKKYDNEVILVMLSWEHGKELSDFKEQCKVHAFNRYPKFWIFGDTLKPATTTLGDVRGKMVLVNGHDTGQKGFSAGEMVKQNEWDCGDWTMSAYSRANIKYYAIKRFIDEAKRGASNFYVSGEKYYTTDKKKKNNKYYTYTIWGILRDKVSGTWTDIYSKADNKILYNGWNKQFNFGYSVKYYADYINGWFHDSKWEVTHYPRGIQLMDFYHQENVDNVINSNF